MATIKKGLVSKSYLTDIGNAIRAKNGLTTTYKPSEMAAAIEAISSGSSDDTPTLTFIYYEKSASDEDSALTLKTKTFTDLKDTTTWMNFLIQFVQTKSGNSGRTLDDYLIGAVAPCKGKVFDLTTMNPNYLIRFKMFFGTYYSLPGLKYSAKSAYSPLILPSAILSDYLNDTYWKVVLSESGSYITY